MGRSTRKRRAPIGGLACSIVALLLATEGHTAAVDLKAVHVPSDYSRVRPKLLALGLKPVAVSAAFRREETRTITCGAVCKAYPEVLYCAGTGRSPCQLAFTAPDGRIVLAFTTEEEPERLTLTGIAYASRSEAAEVREIVAGRPEM